MKKTWILILSIIAGVTAFCLIGLYFVSIFPQNPADVRFEKEIEKAAAANDEIDFTTITDFDWDTLYYVNDAYTGEKEVSELIGVNAPVRSVQWEYYKRIVFTKDGEYVRYFVLGGFGSKFNFAEYGACFSVRAKDAVFNVTEGDGYCILEPKGEFKVINDD